MIQLKNMINPAQILVNINVTSKKRALEMLAKAIVVNHNELNEQQIFDLFVDRERLGSTGFGNGVAIPHCRTSLCQEPIIAILTLPVGIDFSAIDEQVVDILIALVVPEASTDEHLQLLKQIAELLNDAEIRTAMRQATTSEGIYQLIAMDTGNNIG